MREAIRACKETSMYSPLARSATVMSTGWPPTSAKTRSVVTTNSRIALQSMSVSGPASVSTATSMPRSARSSPASSTHCVDAVSRRSFHGDIGSQPLDERSQSCPRAFAQVGNSCQIPCDDGAIPSPIQHRCGHLGRSLDRLQLARYCVAQPRRDDAENGVSDRVGRALRRNGSSFHRAPFRCLHLTKDLNG